MSPPVRVDEPDRAAAAQNAGTARTTQIAAAALAFLNTLGTAHRAMVHLPFPPHAEAVAAHFWGGRHGDVDRTGEQYGLSMWSNFPVSDVPRPGLRMGELNNTQCTAMLNLLRALLSGRGYAKVSEIMGADQALAEKGQRYACGLSAYTIAIFGPPAIDQPWMVQFGGHHLALNITMLGEHGVLAPVLTGCLPAIYRRGGERVRVLAGENDKAFSLFGLLDEAQRGRATIDHDVSALALGPGHGSEVVQPVGVQASALDARQRGVLYELIVEWAGMLNDTHAAPRLKQISDGMDDTWFAWSGPGAHEPGCNGASYFRIQGPNLFIEFSPQTPGGDLTMHAHTIYRDPTNAYGKALRVVTRDVSSPATPWKTSGKPRSRTK